MNKIRTLIGCEDENIANTVANDLNKSKFVEVVGIANNGIDTLNQIVNLKPEVVFSQYYFGVVDRILLIADQRGYIQYNIQTVTLVINLKIQTLATKYR